MKRFITSIAVMALAALCETAQAQVPTAAFRWNFDQTNSTAITSNVFPTLPNGNTPELGGLEGLLTMFNQNLTTTNLLGSPGSGVSSGQFPAIPFDRALNLKGVMAGSGPMVATATVGNTLTNFPAIITNFTLTAWLKADAGFTGFPRIIGMGAQGVDPADNGLQLNEIGLLLFNNGDIQLKVHGGNNNGANTGPDLPLGSAQTNWAFVAVTYDGALDMTADLTTNNVFFYVGNRVDSLTNGYIGGRRYTASTTVNSVAPGGPGGPGFINFTSDQLNGDGSFSAVSNVWVYIGNRPTDRNRSFNGRYDDIRFFPNQLLSQTQLDAVRLDAPPGSAGPLTFIQPPQNQVRLEGEAIQFSVLVSEAPNRSYQWFRITPSGTSTSLVATTTSPFYITPALTVAGDNNAKYFVRVSSSDPGAGIATSPAATINVVAPGNVVNVPGLLKLELFNNVAGADVASLLAFTNYPNTPDLVQYLPSFDTRSALPDDSRFNFGVRISGWITPTVTTNYVFYLRGSDQALLELSTDDTTNNLVQIAADTRNGEQVFYGPESVSPTTTEVVSTPVSLVAGNRYAVRLLLKGSSGVDVAQVAWRMNADPFANDLPANVENLAGHLKPIPAAYLSTTAPSNGVVSITQGPVGTSLPAHSRHTLTVVASGTTSPLVIQWQENGTNIAGATGASYTTPYLTATAQYRAVVSAPGATASNSVSATVTVTADNVAPQVVGAISDDTMHSVTVQFSEPVDSVTALNINNYSIPGLTVVGAAYSAGTNLVDQPPYDAVKLTTTGQADNAPYTVTVSNVKDLANNTIAGGNNASFRSYVLVPGYAKESYFENQTFNTGIYLDDLTVNYLVNNSLKVTNDVADTIVYPTALAFSPIGQAVFRSAAGGANFFTTPAPFSTRLRTYITPATTGNYIFYISADDSGLLWLSPDSNPANKRLIAAQQFADGFQGNWAANATANPNTSSATFDTNTIVSLVPDAAPWPVTDASGFAVITLQAGQRYYLQADHRESASFTSFCAVNWDNGTGTPPANGTLLSGNVIGWTFPGPNINSITKTGNDVQIAWTGLGNVDKGFLGFPGVVENSITPSYPTSELQSAPVVTGPYTTLTNTSPVSTPATLPAQFFRVSGQ